MQAIKAFGFTSVSLTAEQVIEPARMIEIGVAPVLIHVTSQIDGVSWDEVWRTHVTGA